MQFRRLPFALAIVLASTLPLIAADPPPADATGPLPLVEHLIAQQKRHEALLERVLTARVEVEFTKTPLEEVIAILAERADLPLHLERQALDDAGIPSDEPVSLPASNSRLVAVFYTLLLRDLQLTWVIEDDRVVITTIDLANERLQSRVFVVDDLLGWLDESRRDRFGNSEPVASGFGGTVIRDAQGSLVDLLQSNIANAQWVDIDGAVGTLSFTGGLLVVRQTDAVLQQIKRLITQLRGVLATKPSAGVWLVELQGSGAPENEEVRQKLNRKIAVDFRDTPLTDALKSLGEELDFPVLIDQLSLDDAGIPSDEPVTLKTEAALHSVLSQLLRDLQLTYVVTYGWMEITTVDLANERLTMAVFDIRDLDAIHGFSKDELISTIQSETNGQWEDIDGAGGTLQVQGGLLFITQTHETLAEVQVLLTNLRAKHASRKLPDAARQAERNRVETRFYKSRNEDEVAALREALTTFVFPDSWETNGGHGFVQDVGPTLIVRQTPLVHEAIEKFLLELNSRQATGDATKP